MKPAKPKLTEEDAADLLDDYYANSQEENTAAEKADRWAKVLNAVMVGPHSTELAELHTRECRGDEEARKKRAELMRQVEHEVLDGGTIE